MRRSSTAKPLSPSSRGRPALTPEAREGQMISLTMDLVEQRLRDGTASSQETTHFLKLASEKAKRENLVLELQAELLKAKTQSIQAQGDTKELYERAIQAMSRYSGEDEDEYFQTDY